VSVIIVAQLSSKNNHMTSLLLAQQGKRALAIDADPQANLTFYLNHEVQPNQPSLLAVLTGQVTTEDGIYSTGYENLFISQIGLLYF